MLAERPLPADLDQRLESLARAWAGDPDLAAAYLFDDAREFAVGVDRWLVQNAGG